MTLTETPSSGSTFTSWSGCNSASGTTCTVTMNQNKTVIATFTAMQTFVISGYVTTCGAFPNPKFPISGVVMTGLPGNPITNSQGYYSATVPYDWSGTVTPRIPGQPSSWMSWPLRVWELLPAQGPV